MSYWSSASFRRPILTPCLTNCGKYSAYLVAMSCLRDLLAERLVADRVEQQPRGDEAVRRVLLDQRARGQHHALAHLVHRHAVVEVLQRRLEDPLGVDVGQALARFADELRQAGEVERVRDAVVDDGDRAQPAVPARPSPTSPARAPASGARGRARRRARPRARRRASARARPGPGSPRCGSRRLRACASSARRRRRR